jgi:hypothetical protein
MEDSSLGTATTDVVSFAPRPVAPALPPLQLPPWQVSPAAQALPHAPQLAGSVLVSTQVLPQRVSPRAQLDTQWPPWHVV